MRGNSLLIGLVVIFLGMVSANAQDETTKIKTRGVSYRKGWVTSKSHLDLRAKTGRVLITEFHQPEMEGGALNRVVYRFLWREGDRSRAVLIRVDRGNSSGLLAGYREGSERDPSVSDQRIAEWARLDDIGGPVRFSTIDLPASQVTPFLGAILANPTVLDLHGNDDVAYRQRLAYGSELVTEFHRFGHELFARRAARYAVGTAAGVAACVALFKLFIH
jgi:hypothetical protein